MKNIDRINKNIELSFKFVDKIIDNPVIADNLPSKFVLEFEENDNAKITICDKDKVKSSSGFKRHLHK